jgi:hypothetical protein
LRCVSSWPLAGFLSLPGLRGDKSNISFCKICAQYYKELSDGDLSGKSSNINYVKANRNGFCRTNCPFRVNSSVFNPKIQLHSRNLILIRIPLPSIAVMAIIPKRSTKTYNESRKVVTPRGNGRHMLQFSKSRIARSWMPPKTGPIPRELLESALYSSGMTAQDTRARLRSCEWQALTSRNSQVVFLSEFGETDTASRLTTDDIVMTFNISPPDPTQSTNEAKGSI